MTTVLIVEDEIKIASLLGDFLGASGFEHHWVERGDAAVAEFKSIAPDLVLLDLNLPGLDGMSVCREIRAISSVPIIMVTARVEEIDRLIGLELGADDYICKPFSPREVVARVKAVFRRMALTESVSHGDSYRGIRVDQGRFRCTVGDQVVDLTPVEFRILALMIAQPGRVFSRDRLMDVAYQDSRVVSDRTIDSHIRNMRSKLKPLFDDEVIQSIYGVGYKVE